MSHVAYHESLDVLRAPYLFALANSPQLLNIVATFLGCRPTLGYIAAWWSYHTDIGAQEAELFHRDVDDWRFVKLFVYLTDVGEKGGPHVYVSHSAAGSKLRRIARFSDAEVAAAYGTDGTLEIAAHAGSGFLEDTFGLHKGQAVAEGRRLMFQAVYSMFALPYGPKATIATSAEMKQVHSREFDPWTNRLYVSG